MESEPYLKSKTTNKCTNNFKSVGNQQQSTCQKKKYTGNGTHSYSLFVYLYSFDEHSTIMPKKVCG